MIFSRKTNFLRDLLIPVFFLSLLIFVLIIPFTEGQSAVVKGRVYVRDYLRNFIPAGFALILARSESFENTIRTDTDGYYLAYLPAGIYNMTAVMSTVSLDYAQTKVIALWYTSDTIVNFYLEPVILPEFQQIKVMIHIDGVPPQYSIDLFIDNASAGMISGDGTLQLSVNPKSTHKFIVQSYVEGSNGERYYCKENVWILSESTLLTKETALSHTFQYLTQYFLNITIPYGDAAKNSGWYSKGTSISLEAIHTVEVTQGIKDVFDSWIISDLTRKDSTMNIIVDSPLAVKAEYHREYYLQLISPYGRPSGSGWYKEGNNAKIEIEEELPSTGLFGVLGAKKVFNDWSDGAYAGKNVAYVYMDSPKMIIANWQEDNSIPYIIILLTLVVIGLAVFLLRKNGGDN